MTTTKLKIRYYGDPALRKKSVRVKKVGPAERILISSMIKAVHKNQGIGLAAPQVGVNEQIFVADIGDGPIAVINPKITKKRGYNIMEEGCLSFPGINFRIKRSKKVVVRYIDEHNQKVERECDELLSKVFQHEMDHLKGKLIVDYASWREKLKLRAKLKELRRLGKTKLVN